MVDDSPMIRVMIVDDHYMVREGLKVFLSTLGDITVVGEAENGAQAVQRCSEARPDVVLMDLLMPVMDGATATARIREACPTAQVIALTSFVEQELVQEALDAGAISYLLKDARPEKLAEAIREAVKGRGHDRQRRDAGDHGEAPRQRGRRPHAQGAGSARPARRRAEQQ